MSTIEMNLEGIKIGSEVFMRAVGEVFFDKIP
jgi:hypothetical protein